MTVAEFLAKSREEQAQEQKRQREELLISLGLYEEIREYAPDEYNTQYLAELSGYPCRDTAADGVWRFYRMQKRALEVTDEEYAEICRIEERRQKAKKVQPATDSESVDKPQTMEGELAQEPSMLAIAVGAILQIMGLVILFWGGRYFELDTTFGGDSYTYIYQACIHAALYLRIGLCGILLGISTLLEIMAGIRRPYKVHSTTK